jgi:nucleoid-associated protein YgaU
MCLTVVVLVLGLGLAWRFRKSGEPAPSGTDKSLEISASHPLQTEMAPSMARMAVPTETANSADSRTAKLIGASPLRNDSMTIENGGPGSAAMARSDDSVPSLSPSFPGTDHHSTAEAPQGLPFGLGSLAQLSPTHRIADGDTLAQLAAHYLGTADRWRELYDLNRDVLMNPELLPIGAELRIPTSPFVERGEGPGARAQGDPRPASPAGEAPAAAWPVSHPMDGSVNQPTASNASPPAASIPEEPTVRLKLRKLPPFAADGPALHVAPRTYIVQRGDTLNSIAERLYNDGAKETVLLEANRNLVASPQDVRPGMVLVIPADAATMGTR